MVSYVILLWHSLCLPYTYIHVIMFYTIPKALIKDFDGYEYVMPLQNIYVDIGLHNNRVVEGNRHQGK